MSEQKLEGVQQQINELMQKAMNPTTGNVAGFAATLLAAKLQTLLLQAREQEKDSKEGRVIDE